MKNNTTFFLLLMGSGTGFISKKIKKNKDSLKKSHPKNIPSRSGIRKNSSQIRNPDPGGKRHRITDPQHCLDPY
jgi:hypothetical protein